MSKYFYFWSPCLFVDKSKVGAIRASNDVKERRRRPGSFCWCIGFSKAMPYTNRFVNGCQSEESSKYLCIFNCEQSCDARGYFWIKQEFSKLLERRKRSWKFVDFPSIWQIFWQNLNWLLSELQNSLYHFSTPLMRSQHTWITYCRCFDKPAAVYIIKGSIIRTLTEERLSKSVCKHPNICVITGRSFIFKNITPAARCRGCFIFLQRMTFKSWQGVL